MWTPRPRPRAPVAPKAANVPAKRVGGPTPSSVTITVSKDAKGEDRNVDVLIGKYTDSGRRNDGAVVFAKTAESKRPQEPVFLFYWGPQDGPDQQGWWFGKDVGSSMVWCWAKCADKMPPRFGWRVPVEGDPLAPILVHSDVDVTAEPKSAARQVRPKVAAPSPPAAPPPPPPAPPPPPGAPAVPPRPPSTPPPHVQQMVQQQQQQQHQWQQKSSWNRQGWNDSWQQPEVKVPHQKIPQIQKAGAGAPASKVAAPVILPQQEKPQPKARPKQPIGPPPSNVKPGPSDSVKKVVQMFETNMSKPKVQETKKQLSGARGELLSLLEDPASDLESENPFDDIDDEDTGVWAAANDSNAEDDGDQAPEAAEEGKEDVKASDGEDAEAAGKNEDEDVPALAKAVPGDSDDDAEIPDAEGADVAGDADPDSEQAEEGDEAPVEVDEDGEHASAEVDEDGEDALDQETSHPTPPWRNRRHPFRRQVQQKRTRQPQRSSPMNRPESGEPSEEPVRKLLKATAKSKPAPKRKPSRPARKAAPRKPKSSGSNTQKNSSSGSEPPDNGRDFAQWVKERLTGKWMGRVKEQHTQWHEIWEKGSSGLMYECRTWKSQRHKDPMTTPILVKERRIYWGKGTNVELDMSALKRRKMHWVDKAKNRIWDWQRDWG